MNFSERRAEQIQLGKDNGLKSFSHRAYYAALQGGGAGVAYGVFNWAYYPDKFLFSHKNTVVSGLPRGVEFLNRTMLRPAVYFSAIGITFAAVESFLEEMTGHPKDAKNTAAAGFAAGVVMGGFFTRRFDIASMTGLGLSLVMAAVEINGPRMISDPDTELARNKPEKVTIKFEESEDLAGLKEKYPRYKNN